MDKEPLDKKPASPDSSSTSTSPTNNPETPPPAAATAVAPGPAPAAETAPSAPAKRNEPFWPTVKRRARTTWTFCKEAWDEHDLWVEALAVKGGASAIIIAGVVALASVVALPFFAAAAVIAGCGALLGVGIYGCAAAGAKCWESIRGVYNRVRGREPPQKVKKEKKDITTRLAESKWVKKAMEHRWAQKVMNSRAWKQTQKFTQRREDSIIHGIAFGGAIVTLALGATVLMTQVLVLPVVAIGGLLTWAAAEVAVCFASGAYGLYLTGESWLHKRREKKEALKAAREKPLQLGDLSNLPPIQLPKPAAKTVIPKQALTEAFTNEAGNDNKPVIPVPANDAKPADEKRAVPAAKNPPGPSQP